MRIESRIRTFSTRYYNCLTVKIQFRLILLHQSGQVAGADGGEKIGTSENAGRPVFRRQRLKPPGVPVELAAQVYGFLQILFFHIKFFPISDG